MHDELLITAQDRLHQIIPIILVSDQDVKTMRKTVGKYVWRKLHHAPEHINFLRSLVWLRFQDQATWAEIVEIPEDHLRSCRNAIDWPTARVASKLAEPGRFLHTIMLVRDVVRLGGSPSRCWSLAKLKREYSRLSIKSAISSADPRPWCEPFTADFGDFKFSRLISDRDFVVEGKTQRHCVASMRDEAKSGATVVLSCVGPERATVRINPDGTLEVAGFANAPVSDHCLDAAREVRRFFDGDTFSQN